MPRPTWKPASELTPFALMIREGYMWKQKPPMTMSDFAGIVHVSKQSVFHWLRDGSQPKRGSVIAVADATGIDRDELLRAAGHPDTATYERQQRAAHWIYRGKEKEARGKLAAKRYTPEEIERFMVMLRDLQPEVIDEAIAASGGNDDDLETKISLSPQPANPSLPGKRRGRTSMGASH